MGHFQIRGIERFMTDLDADQHRDDGSDVANLEKQKETTGKLDTLPREALVNLIRKQLLITKDLKRRSAQYKLECETLQSKLSEVNKEENSLAELQLSDFRKSYSQLKKKLEETEAQLKEKVAAVDQLKLGTNDVNEKNTYLEQKCEELIAQVSLLKDQVECERQKADDGFVNLDNIKKDADERTQMVQTELEQVQNSVDRLQKTLDETRKEAESLREERSKLIKSNESLQRNVDVVRSEFDNYRSRTESLLRIQSGTDCEPQANGFEFHELTRRLETMYKELEDEREKVGHLQHACETQKERNESLKGELDDARISLALVQRDALEQRKKVVQESEERVKRVAQERDQLKADVHSLKSRTLNSASTQHHTADGAYVNDLKEQLSQLKQKVQLLESVKAESSVPQPIEVQRVHHTTAPVPINFSTEPRFSNHALNPSESFEPSESADLVNSLKDLIHSDAEESSTVVDFPTNLDASYVQPEVVQMQLEYTRSLLRDSEDSNAKLDDQVKFLKEEIRRAERERERSKHLAGNTEYLKNVVLQFLAPERVSETRQQLLPVLVTLLSLTPQEKAAIEKHLNEQHAKPSTSTEWSGYLGPLSGIF